ncbi:MAG: extracellular solute-binding protein [Cellulosilyticaceae bacterium]
MKLKMKCVLALALAGIMVLTGCSSTGGAKVEEGTTTTTTSDKKEETKKDVTLDFFYYDGLRVFKSDSPIWKKIQADTGITLNGAAPTTPGGEHNEQFNLMLASGDIPDIIHAVKANIIKNGDKLFTPLEDLIDEHAPNIKKMLEERPDVKAAATGTDGHIYFIPYLPDGEVSEVMYIRKDWLDKFNLPIPTTVQEYETALKTFREQDANGNGKKDEIGYFDRAGNTENGIAAVFNLYGASFERYVKDGVIIDDRYKPEFKTTVENVARIYSEGLIDPEIYTRGKDSREVMFEGNMGASTTDWIASTAKYQTTYEGQIEGLEWVPILQPANLNGEVMTQYSRPQIYDGGWGISKECKDPVDAIKLFDYMFSEEGARVMNFGIEGETYDMVEGKPVFKEEVLNADKPVNDQIKDMGYLQIGYPQDFEYERQWTNDIALAGIDLYLEADPFLDIVPNLGLTQTPEELELISKKGPALKSYTEEMLQKWVLGSEDINSSFDKYLEKCKELGSDEILAAYQAAYDRAYK